MAEDVQNDSGIDRQNKSGGGKWLMILMLLLIVGLGVGMFFFRDKISFLNGESADENLAESLVLDVIDAKTIEVLYEGNEEEVISVIGIEVPSAGSEGEYAECFGEETYNKANELLGGENVILEDTGERDDEGNILAYVRLLSLEDYGEKMLWDGYVWRDAEQYHEKLDSYGEAEEFARANGIGLWSSDTCNGERIVIEREEQEVVTMPEEIEVVDELIEPEVIEEQEAEGYDCSEGAYSCEDFSGTGAVVAQDVFDYCWAKEGEDVHGLDSDENGVACDEPEEEEILTDPEADAAIEKMVKLPSSGARMVYDCSYDRYSCYDFSNATDAQVMFEICKARGVGDIHKLDSDKNGFACEYLGR